MAEKEKLSQQPDPRLLQDLEFFKSLGMMEMLVDTGADKAMPPVPPAKAPPKEGKKP